MRGRGLGKGEALVVGSSVAHRHLVVHYLDSIMIEFCILVVTHTIYNLVLSCSC